MKVYIVIENVEGGYIVQSVYSNYDDARADAEDRAEYAGLGQWTEIGVEPDNLPMLWCDGDPECDNSIEIIEREVI